MVADGNRRTVWELIDYKRPDPDGDKFVRVHRGYDCGEKNYWVIFAEYFKGNMASGELTASTVGTMGPTDIDLKSPAGDILNYLCAK